MGAVYLRICCGQELMFNDNSISQILLRGKRHSDPVYHCLICKKYYNLDHSNEPASLCLISKEIIKKFSIQKWFSADVMMKLQEFRTQLIHCLTAAEAYQRAFNNNYDELPAYFYNGKNLYHCSIGGDQEISTKSYNTLMYKDPMFSCILFERETVQFHRNAMETPELSHLISIKEVDLLLKYGFITRREHQRYVQSLTPVPE
ncbi:MAG: hypothetical protein JWM44_2077 [Bacilli bacterium]|nr:hypothetical protein [Bacilli bacterium]